MSLDHHFENFWNEISRRRMVAWKSATGNPKGRSLVLKVCRPQPLTSALFQFSCRRGCAKTLTCQMIARRFRQIICACSGTVQTYNVSGRAVRMYSDKGRLFRLIVSGNVRQRLDHNIAEPPDMRHLAFIASITLSQQLHQFLVLLRKEISIVWRLIDSLLMIFNRVCCFDAMRLHQFFIPLLFRCWLLAMLSDATN